MTMINIDMHFPEMRFGNSYDECFFFSFSVFFFFMRTNDEGKTTKNKLIFFSFARLSRHVNGLNCRCRRCRRKQKKKKKTSYVSDYACVLCRARQLGNRNNTHFSMCWRLRCPVLFFSFLSLFFTLIFGV